MAKQSEIALKTLNDLLSNPGPYSLSPKAPDADVPENDISNINLSEPPSYELGQQVLSF